MGFRSHHPGPMFGPRNHPVMDSMDHDLMDLKIYIEKPWWIGDPPGLEKTHYIYSIYIYIDIIYIYILYIYILCVYIYIYYVLYIYIILYYIIYILSLSPCVNQQMFPSSLAVLFCFSPPEAETHLVTYILGVCWNVIRHFFCGM